MLELGSIFKRKNTTEISNRMTSYTNPQGTTELTNVLKLNPQTPKSSSTITGLQYTPSIP